MSNTDEIANLLGFNKRGSKRSLFWGKVDSVSGDTAKLSGSTYQVVEDTQEIIDTRQDAIVACNCNVGDSVLVANVSGDNVVLAIKGGEHHEQPEQTYIYDTVINNMNWTVQRTGDFVQAWGRDTKSESASSSSAYRNDTFTLPVAFDTGSNLGFNAHMSYTTIWCMFLQPTTYARTTLGAYVGIEGGHGAITYARQLYVAGRSTSDVSIRTYTERELAPWVLRADGKDVYIKNSHDDNPPYSWSWWNPITSSIAPTLSAGTYQIGLNCNSDVLDNRTFKFPIGGIDKDVLMFCCAVLDGTSCSNVGNWIAYNKINNSQTKDDIDTLYPHLTNTFTLTEPAKVQLWFTMIGGGEAYDVALTPWIRRIK